MWHNSLIWTNLHFWCVDTHIVRFDYYQHVLGYVTCWSIQRSHRISCDNTYNFRLVLSLGYLPSVLWNEGVKVSVDWMMACSDANLNILIVLTVNLLLLVSNSHWEWNPDYELLSSIMVKNKETFLLLLLLLLHNDNILLLVNVKSRKNEDSFSFNLNFSLGIKSNWEVTLLSLCTGW